MSRYTIRRIGSASLAVRWLAWSGLAAAGALLSWLSVLPYADSRRTELSQRNSAQQHALEQKTIHYRQLRRQTHALDKAAHGYSASVANLPAHPDVGTLSADISRLSRQHGMQLTHLLPIGTGREDFYQFSDIRTTLRGNYQNLARFVDGLSELSHPIRLVELSLDQERHHSEPFTHVETGTNNSPPLNIQLRMRGYCCINSSTETQTGTGNTGAGHDTTGYRLESLLGRESGPEPTPAIVKRDSAPGPSSTHPDDPFNAPVKTIEIGLQRSTRVQDKPLPSPSTTSAVVARSSVLHDVSAERAQGITIVPVHYTRAQRLAELLRISLGEGERTIAVDERTNAVILQNHDSNLRAARDAILALDVPTKQVLIEAVIVIARQDFAKRLGLSLGLGSNGSPSPANKTTSLLASSGAFSANLQFGFLNNRGQLDIALDAMESAGDGEVISRPRLITSNLQTAYIKAGTQIPFQESAANGRTTVQFRDAVLRLDVTPIIMPDDKIRLDLIINQDSPGATINTGNAHLPTIDTTELRTQIVLNPHETATLGGVFRYDAVKSKSKTPVLGDIPLLGHLFRHSNKNIVKSETMFFITPYILDNESR